MRLPRINPGDMGMVDMNDIIVDVSLSSAEEDALLSHAVDAFILELAGLSRNLTDAPDMMVRTTFSPSGAISKKVIFQERKLAEAFVDFWEHQKVQAAAA